MQLYDLCMYRYEKCSKEHWLCEDRDMTLKSTLRQDYEVDVEEPPPQPGTDKVVFLQYGEWFVSCLVSA